MKKNWLATLSALLLLAACGGSEQKGAPAGQGGQPAAQAADASGAGADLTGAGATFPDPLYKQWFYRYAQDHGIKINYQSIGSGGGIRQITERTVDFGASDGPMSDQELAAAPGKLLHFPTTIGAVAITYNLDGVQTGLKLTGEVLANIFLGKVTKWNDASIAALNPGVKLPGVDILVVHRSDGSGTTFIFTDYLSAVSPTWAKAPGKGKDVSWPVGLGGKGNEGVAGQIKQTPGAIGYVELAYAKQNNLPVAAMKNAAGSFVVPSIEGATAAASGVAEKLTKDSDFRISIVNAPGATAYPISSFTWILAYEKPQDVARAKKLVGFLKWALVEGQEDAPNLDYAPLPDPMVKMELERLAQIDTVE